VSKSVVEAHLGLPIIFDEATREAIPSSPPSFLGDVFCRTQQEDKNEWIRLQPAGSITFLRE
jgi:hypothetical protein